MKRFIFILAFSLGHFSFAITHVGDTATFKIRIRNTGTSQILMAPNWPPTGFCGDSTREYLETDTVLDYKAANDTYVVKVHRQCTFNASVLETIETLKSSEIFGDKTYKMQMMLCDLNKGEKYKNVFDGSEHQFCNYKSHDGLELNFGDIPFGIVFMNKIFSGGYIMMRRTP